MQIRAGPDDGSTGAVLCTPVDEADHKRMFEVTPQGETVWEYQIPLRWRAGRCHRVPYDFATILADLPRPLEVRINQGVRSPRPVPFYEHGSAAPLVSLPPPDA